jgi:hypothetical protein
MTLYTHQITLKHDKGTTKLIVTGTSEKANINSVLLAENCPMCAIINIKLIKKERIE